MRLSAPSLQHTPTHSEEGGPRDKIVCTPTSDRFLFRACRDLVVAVVAISILLTWLYNRTEGSVLLVMIMHASINSAGTFIPVQSMESLGEWAVPLEVSLVGLFWVAALVVIVTSNWKLFGRPVGSAPAERASADSAV